jgi:hypothetical protein
MKCDESKLGNAEGYPTPTFAFLAKESGKFDFSTFQLEFPSFSGQKLKLRLRQRYHAEPALPRQRRLRK